MSRPYWRPLFLVVGLLFVMAPALALAQNETTDDPWPREMKTSKGILTVYQPQAEKFLNDTLRARSAVSLLQTGKTKPIFGVVWFTAKVETDRDQSMVMLRNLKFVNTRWPESTEAQQAEFTAFMNGLLTRTDIPISLERFTASLATAELEQKSLEGLKHDPPKFIFKEEPSQLVLFDGEPRTMEIEKSDYEYVANCTFAML